jgi:hypothetical protein
VPNKSQILIMGPYPSPIGGVSIHIQRFVDYLLKNNYTNFSIFDESKEGDKVIPESHRPYYFKKNKLLFLLKLFFFNKYKMIHYHSGNWYVRFILIMIGKIHQTKLIFTFHSLRDDINNFNLIKKALAKIVINNVDQIIAVGNNEKEKLINFNCKKEKISVIPAFISPLIESNRGNHVTDDLMQFVELYDHVIIANASGIRFYNNNDLYGIDMCVDLMIDIKHRLDKKVGLIFFLSQVEDEEYLNKLKRKISNGNISNDFLFVTEKRPLHTILRYSSLLIRPTNSDGDAISVREAIFYKIPVIASDAVIRPDGTILFKNRDISDLIEKVILVIENYKHYKEKSNNVNQMDYAYELFKIYSNTLKW